jgi:hypothetical protein
MQLVVISMVFGTKSNRILMAPVQPLMFAPQECHSDLLKIMSLILTEDLGSEFLIMLQENILVLSSQIKHHPILSKTILLSNRSLRIIFYGKTQKVGFWAKSSVMLLFPISLLSTVELLVCNFSQRIYHNIM